MIRNNHSCHVSDKIKVQFIFLVRMSPIKSAIVAITENRNVIKNGLRCFRYNFTKIANTAAQKPDKRARTNHIIVYPLVNLDPVDSIKLLL